MQSRSKAVAFLFLICMIGFLLSSFAQAKPSIDLVFEKNNGYGFGNDIGGLWTVRADVSSDMQDVEFYLDGRLQLNDTFSPFSWQFDTINYSSGSHAIKAIAYDSSGDTAFLQVERNFQETSTATVTSYIVAVIVAIIIVTIAVAIYRTRKLNHR
jgi:hypothetical protein